MKLFINILIFLLINLIFSQQQYNEYSSNNNPFYSSTNHFTPYGKSSYFYLTPYGNYGKSGYEGPPFGINSYWQPGIATYPSGYGQFGGYNPSLQCIDQLTNCALQASSGKCSYSPNTLAKCPISCGIPCQSNGYNYNNGGNPSLPLSSVVYRDPSQIYGSNNYPYDYNDNYNQFQPFSQPLHSTTTPNNYPFYCRDSHIYGCQNWAKLGFCQKIPEFMLNYCRASCGVCDNISSYSSTYKTPTTISNIGTTQYLKHGPPEPFGGINSNEFLQKESNNYLPYSHYYYLNSPLRTAFGAERKEKQDGILQNKFLLSEDDEPQQILRQPLSHEFTNDWIKQSNNNNNFDNLHNLTPSQMPPSTLSTQHSSISKLIKMDDLLDDK